MIFPLEELIKYEKNMYEITCAASKRAYQISMVRMPEYSSNEEKNVSLAAREVFTGEVEFRFDNETSRGIPDLHSTLQP
ncbi:MAG: DNA-directed RNA polymerase subunit omega [Spirochaetaceae bacterium]|jgi:DNA-directed RNA polymerase subunit omega|nr:DNA-directed RNA polymerase subunit omega [Spirochaetaceae bacterium]